MSGQNLGKAVFGALLLTFAAIGGAEAGDRDHGRHDHDRRDRYEQRGDRHYDRGARHHDQKAYRDHRDYHRGDRRDGHRGDHRHRGGRDVVVIDRGARTVITSYYHGYYRDARSCPRGFKFKHGVCRPRGWSKPRYVIGQPLPRYVVVQPMPPLLVRQLPPPPMGYMYQYADGDVLMVAEATHRVVDAVVAVNAAMNALR